ncbi:exodeoxyribonuclease III [Stappia sp. MMSF_3263]|uniref:exodeoxyribonuclease III n=1 Tax=Stappia sp. MMSF_3263 TaxID=3046693 RepID=UPI00273E3298|nr:exodeoxyribonuclease III [Stappia sp. MMSF_3263]
MKIATWNINGVKARLETTLAWLDEAKPDLACLQEIKSVDEGFPRAAFEEAGYQVETHGQKGFNGVALLSRRPLTDIARGLPGDDSDEQARYIEARVETDGHPLRVGCLYLPNGNPLGTEKFPYKLGWMDRLIRHARMRLEEEERFVLLGDYNVIPDPRDARHPQNWTDDALFQPESRGAYRALLALGLTDAVRATNQEDGVYTFWDYQAGAWQKNNGIRIDHVLLSPEATDILEGVGIDAHVRGWEKPSDHVPVWVNLAA